MDIMGVVGCGITSTVTSGFVGARGVLTGSLVKESENCKSEN